MVPPWRGCRLLTSSVVVAVMPGTHAASVTGTERGSEAGPLGAQAGSSLGQVGWDLLGFGGFQLLKQPDGD